MGNKNEGYLGGIMGGESRVETSLAGSLDVTTTNSTTSHGEEHTADGTFSTAGDVIIHDGWNQTNTSYTGTNYTKANEGTLVISDGDVTVDVEVWGAAGGSGQGSFTGYGGGGEYRKARMVLKPGTYYWMVGGGGGTGSTNVDRQGSGGWGGGGSSGDYTGPGNDATAWGNGGDISTINNTRNALGAGGGGLTGLFGAATPSQADALLVAGGGGGFGYSAKNGDAGGTSSSASGSDTAGGVGGSNGSAGKGGSGHTRGGGGGGGYWGGAGATDTTGTAGGGRGFTVASNGHALVGTVSEITTEAGSSQNAGGSGSTNYVTSLGSSVGTSLRCGRGGRIAITIVDLSPGGGSGLKNTGILSLEEAGTQTVGGPVDSNTQSVITTDFTDANSGYTMTSDTRVTKSGSIWDYLKYDISSFSSGYIYAEMLVSSANSSYMAFGVGDGTAQSGVYGGSTSTASIRSRANSELSINTFTLAATSSSQISSAFTSYPLVFSLLIDCATKDVWIAFSSEDGSDRKWLTGATTTTSTFDINTPFVSGFTGLAEIGVQTQTNGQYADINFGTDGTFGGATSSNESSSWFFDPPAEVAGAVSKTLPQVSWGGITGRSVLTGGSSLINTGIFSLEEIYELTKAN
jgi:hypothetical protein